MRTSIVCGLLPLALLGCIEAPFTTATDTADDAGTAAAPTIAQEAGTDAAEASAPEAAPDAPTPDVGAAEAEAAYSVGGYPGIPAGPNCVAFQGSWCGASRYTYVCLDSADAGPYSGGCSVLQTPMGPDSPSPGTIAWCCP